MTPTSRAPTVLAFLAAVILAAAVAGCAVGEPREISPETWDRATLPDQLQVCGRSYRRDSLERIRSAADVEALQGFPPTVVQPLQVQPCVPGPCDDVADPAPCDTVVYVRVGADQYLDYALQGGP